MKNRFIKVISIFLALTTFMLCFTSCGYKVSNSAIVCKDDAGKVTGEVDSKLFSLIVAVVNFQLGADVLESGMWDMPYQEGNNTTVRDIVIAQSKSYAKGLLQAEFLCDEKYQMGLSAQQKDSVDKYVSGLVSVYGSKKNLENALSVYGADVEALTRYMELVIKQDTVYESFYSENGMKRKMLDEKKPVYFSEHFAIADHILVKYSGGVKDDGTEIPITDEEKKEKKEAAKALYNEIVNGVRDFDEALDTFNQDTYKLGYPFGYFIPDSFYWSGISTEVQNAVLDMDVDEIRFVDTESGAYIVRRNKMDSSLYASNGGFEAYIDSALAQEDFLGECEKSGVIEFSEDAISQINPANVPSFNIDAFGSK